MYNHSFTSKPRECNFFSFFLPMNNDSPTTGKRFFDSLTAFFPLHRNSGVHLFHVFCVCADELFRTMSSMRREHDNWGGFLMHNGHIILLITVSLKQKCSRNPLFNDLPVSSSFLLLLRLQMTFSIFFGCRVWRAFILEKKCFKKCFDNSSANIALIHI